MAGYLGYGLKAAVSGFQTGFNMGQMKWQQNEKKKLEKKLEEMEQAASVFNNMVAQLGEDGSYSEDDMMKINTSYMALAYDAKDKVDGTYKAIQAIDKKTIEANYQWFDFVIEATQGMKSGDAQVVFDTIRPFVSGEKGLQMFEAFESIAKEKSEITPKAETFPTAAGVQGAYPGAGVKYTEEGYVPVIGEEAAPKAPTFSEKRFNWRLEQYNLGHITFDQFLKGEGMYIAPEKATGLEKKIQDITTQGKAAGIPQDQINTAIKNEIVGIDIVGEPFNLNDFLFGSNGIMKEYSTGGGKLFPEDIEKIKNNYNLKKNLLLKENQEQVEEFLLSSGIDVNAPTPEPVPEPEPEPGIIQKGIKGVQDWLGRKGETIESRRGLEIPTPEEKPITDRKLGPLVDMEGKPIKDYSAMTEEELYDLAMKGDKEAYEEAKRKGFIK